MYWRGCSGAKHAGTRVREGAPQAVSPSDIQSLHLLHVAPEAPSPKRSSPRAASHWPPCGRVATRGQKGIVASRGGFAGSKRMVAEIGLAAGVKGGGATAGGKH